MSGVDRRALLRGAGLAGVGMVVGAGTAAAVSFHNPFSAYPITGTWQDHLNRGSLGGIDYGMAVGTALPAAGGGRVRNLPDNGTAGHTVTIHHDNGYRTQYMHLSQFLVADGAVVGAGAVIGRSGGAPGAPGSGNSTGPHLHWHMINPSGARINPLQYIGASVLPKTATQWDGVPGPTMWKRAQNWLRLRAGYTGPIDGVPGAQTYMALQRDMRAHWGYTGPIDGVPGGNTWAAVQRLAAAHGYTGPIDGVMGPNSWRGFATFLNADAWDTLP